MLIKKTHLIILFLLLILPARMVSAQYLANPSFEGTPAYSVAPWGTQGCGPNSTPDTQPGFFGVSLPPSHGGSYLGLVCRGPGYNTWETCEHYCLIPFTPGNTYCMHIDLAYSENFFALDWGDTVRFDQPANLRLWGGATNCAKDELLWESGVITNTTWETFTFAFTPVNTSITFLQFEASYNGSISYFGNILIDNIRFSNAGDTILNQIITLNAGEEITLNAGQGSSYSWYPDSGLSCSVCQSPAIIPQANTIYTVSVNNDGCFYNKVFDIRVNYPLIIPNIITPNGDNINDNFYIAHFDNRFALKIYNRWGKMVYYSAQYGNEWHGKSDDGNELPDGTYYYNLISLTGPGNLTGSVIIAR